MSVLCKTIAGIPLKTEKREVYVGLIGDVSTCVEAT
jgi:hypothetical protein